jgi:predicted aldo/keto reductase-like oxidoreductase
MKRRMFLQGVSAAAAVPIAGCSVMSGKNEGGEGKIPLRPLGKTGIMVSMLGFGSHLKEPLIKNPKLRDRMIKTGYEGGINIFDVYDHSGYKQFEPMGKSLEGFRKNVVVSLCFVQPDEKLDAELTDALTKFKTDYIDCYRQYSVNDTRIKFAEDARKAGKIRAIGVVTHDTATMMQALDKYGEVLDYVMIPFNFHHNNGYFMDPKNYSENDYSALIPRCEKMGLGIMGIKPMGSDHMIELAIKEKMLDRNGLNIAQAMLRYVFQFSEVDVTFPSMNSMGEVKTDLNASYKPSLSPAEKELLVEMSAKAAATKRAYLPAHYKWLEDWSSGRVV